METHHTFQGRHAWWLSHIQLFVTPWTVALQAPLSKQQYWSLLPFPPRGYLPDSGTETASPALAGVLYHCTTWEVLIVTHQQTTWYPQAPWQFQGSPERSKSEQWPNSWKSPLPFKGCSTVHRMDFPKLLNQLPSDSHLNCLQFLTNWQV